MSKPKGYGEAALRLLKKVCWEQRVKMVWTRPMAKGTYQTLRELLPADAISSKKIYAALCCHAHSPGYLRLLKTNADRLAPGGKKSDKVTQEEAEFARTKLKKCRKPKAKAKAKAKPNVQVRHRRTVSHGRK